MVANPIPAATPSRTAAYGAGPSVGPRPARGAGSGKSSTAAPVQLIFSGSSKAFRVV